MTNSDIGTAPAGQEQALYTAPFLMTAATHEGKLGDETGQRIEANTSKQHHRHHRLIEWFSRVEPAELDLNPRNAPTLRIRAACLAKQGRQSEAAEVARKVLDLEPELTLSRVRARFIWMNNTSKLWSEYLSE